MFSFLFWQPSQAHFSWLLFFFSHWFLWLVIFGLLGFWGYRHRWRRLAAFLLLLLFSEFVEITLKYFSPWPRPFYNLHFQPPPWIGRYSWGSFPSGHAIRSALVLSFLWLMNKPIFYIILPGIFLVNFGRIYFGLHYPVDIMGGFVLGLVIFFLGRKVLHF